MAFLSREFKNLQWYGMTEKETRESVSLFLEAPMAFLPIPQCPPTGQTGGWAFFVHRPRLSGCGRPARRGADPRRGVRFDNGCVFVYNHYKIKDFL